MTNNARLQAALQLAAKGRFIFPADKDKHPIIKDWGNNAATDAKILEAWFKRSQLNLAIVTGHKSSFFCLDVDGEAGKDSLLQLETQYSPIPADTACMAITPSNGVHYYFKMPDGLDLRNSAGKLGKGLDIRANGGYVVVPPSKVINKDGVEAHYEWLTPDITLAKGQPPDAPEWLLNLITTKPKPSVSNVLPKPVIADGDTTTYGRKALDTECTQISHAASGTRNDTLNRSAFNIFRLVAGGEIATADAEVNLHNAAMACGLEAKEIALTISSAKAKALNSPKSAPAMPWQAGSVNSGVQLKSSGLPEPPLEAFPPKIQQLLKQASVAFKQLPIEVPIVAFLAFLAGCVCRSYVVEVKDGWEEGGNLYLGIVANSGTGKSPCFKEFMRPLWKHEIQNKAIWDKEMDVYNLLMEERRKTKDPAELGPMPEKPKRKQFIVEDITLEALGEVLAENPRGILWNSDELSSIMLNFDRYSNNKGGTESRLLSAYDGAPWKITRRDRDKDQAIPSATLSIVGTVQPKILQTLFDKGDAASGFLPRFTFVKAMQEQPPHINDVVFMGQEILDKIADRLLGTPMIGVGDRLLPHKIPLSKEVSEYYFEWHNIQLMDVAWPESQTSRTIAPKIATQVIRIALLLHLLDMALNDEYGHASINMTTLQRAILLGEWIMAHQKLVWLALDIEDERFKTPLEKAIAQTAVELEDKAKMYDSKVLNAEFNNLVCAKMRTQIDDGLIGRTATQMGIKSIRIGSYRGKEISPELLKGLNLSFYLS